jgi:hypothetical protein
MPQLEVVGADGAPAPPRLDQGVEVLEDGDAGANPHEHLHEVDEHLHEEDGVGGEVLQLKPELLRSKRKKEEIGGTSAQEMYELKRMNSPMTRSLRELEPARIFPASSGAVQPKRRCTKSSCSCRQGWLRGDMVKIAADARERIMRKQEGKRHQAKRANHKSAREDERSLQCLEKASAKR